MTLPSKSQLDWTIHGVELIQVEGAEIALKSGQIDALKWPPCLYSEDLW